MRNVVLWLLLLAVLGIEFAVGWTRAGGTAAPFLGLGMAAVVAMGFMRLSAAPRLGAVFVLAGMFWLAVLLGMGSLDRATRHDIFVPYAHND